MYPGGHVVHSYGRLIPHEFPITDLQQISGPDGIGRINCTVSSGTTRFDGRQLAIGGVSQTKNGATATLVVNLSNVSIFQNRDLYCHDSAINYFYLFLSSTSKYTIHTLLYMCVLPASHWVGSRLLHALPLCMATVIHCCE